MTKAIQSTIVGTSEQSPVRAGTGARLSRDLPLDQDRDDPAQRRRPAMIASGDHRQRDRPCPAGPSRVRIGAAWSDRGQPGRPLALERLDRVEQQEQAGAGRQGPHRADREPGRRDQERRVEEAGLDQRRADRLQQEERDEQVEPGAGRSSASSARATCQAPASRPGRRMVIPSAASGAGGAVATSTATRLAASRPALVAVAAPRRRGLSIPASSRRSARLEAPRRPAPARRSPPGWPGSRRRRDRRRVVEMRRPRSTLSQVSFSQRNPAGSISIRARLIRGSSQLGDHSQRKNTSTITIRTGQQEDRDRPARPLARRRTRCRRGRRSSAPRTRGPASGSSAAENGPRNSWASAFGQDVIEEHHRRQVDAEDEPGGRPAPTRTCPRRTRRGGAASRGAARPAAIRRPG